MSYTERFPKPKTKAQVMAGVDPDIIAKSKFIARNTVEYWTHEGERRVRLHATDVVRIKPNGRITLDTGGWLTPTTRDRMDGATPPGWGTSQAKGIMYVHTPAGTFPHVDGAEWCKSGKPVRPSLHRLYPDKYKADMKAVKAYCQKLDAMDATELATQGDPFVAPNDDGRYDERYVRQWLKEGYVFGTIVRRALSWAGHPEQNHGYVVRIHGRAAQCMRRYLKACLGYAH